MQPGVIAYRNQERQCESLWRGCQFVHEGAYFVEEADLGCMVHFSKHASHNINSVERTTLKQKSLWGKRLEQKVTKVLFCRIRGSLTQVWSQSSWWRAEDEIEMSEQRTNTRQEGGKGGSDWRQARYSKAGIYSWCRMVGRIDSSGKSIMEFSSKVH